MPTEAVTGTKSATKKDEAPAATEPLDEMVDLAGPEGYVEPDPPEAQDAQDGSGDAPEPVVHEAQPLADPCGNGTVQVTTADGSTTNIDAAASGWEDEVRAIDPKHYALGRKNIAVEDEKPAKARSTAKKS